MSTVVYPVRKVGVQVVEWVRGVVGGSISISSYAHVESILEQDTEPQISPDVKLQKWTKKLHLTFHRHGGGGVVDKGWTVPLTLIVLYAALLHLIFLMLLKLSLSCPPPLLSCFQCLEKFPVIQHFKFGSLLSIQPVKPWHSCCCAHNGKTKIPTRFLFLWHPRANTRVADIKHL